MGSPTKPQKYDFTDLPGGPTEDKKKKEKYDFSDLPQTSPPPEIIPQVLQAQRDVTAATPRGRVLSFQQPPKVGESRETPKVYTFDEFMGEIKKAQEAGSYLESPGGIEATHAPATGTRRTLTELGKAFLQDPLMSTMGLAAFPVTARYEALHAFLTTRGPDEFSDFVKKYLGSVDESQAQDAYRALLSLYAAMAVGGATSAVVGEGLGLIERATGKAFTRGQRLAIQGQFAVQAGGAAFGAVGAPEGESRAKQAAAFMLMAVPFGIAAKAFAATKPAAVLAPELALLKQARPFDPPVDPRENLPAFARHVAEGAPIPVSTKVEFARPRIEEPFQPAEATIERAKRAAQPTQQELADRIVQAHGIVGAEDFNNRVQEKLQASRGQTNKTVDERVKQATREVADEILADPIAADARSRGPFANEGEALAATEKAFQDAQTETVPQQAPEARIKRDNFSLDLVDTILKNFVDLPDKQHIVLTGLDTPGKALAAARSILKGKDFLSAVHVRPDGKFDVAFGRSGSKLEAQRGEFVNQGFMKGEQVSVDGKIWGFQRQLVGNKEAEVFDLGTGKIQRVRYEDIRRLPSQPVETISPENYRALEAALTPEEFSLYKSMVNAMISGEELPRPDLLRAAASNGLHIDRSPAGGYIVRDQHTGEVLFRSHYKEEAQNFVNQSGQTTGETFDYLGGVPPEIPGSVMPPPTQPPAPNTPLDMATLHRGAAAAAIDWLQTTRPGRFFTAMPDILSSLDGMFGTEFMAKIYRTTQDAAQLRDIHVQPYREQLRKSADIIERDVPTNRWELVSDYRQTASYKEIRDGALGRPMTARERNITEQFIAWNLDTTKVYKYLRTRDAVLKDYADKNGISKAEIPEADRAQLINQLNTEMVMTPNELSAAQSFEAIHKMDLDEVSLFYIEEATNAALGKSPTRPEFAQHEKMTPAELKVAQQIDQLYKDIGEAIGIEDARMIERYMNRYASHGYHGTPFDSNVLWQRRKDGLRGEAPAAREFISKMIRSGELSNYERDPIVAAARYIHSAFTSKDFLPVWEKAMQDARETIKAQPDPAIRDFMRSIVMDSYLSEMRGRPEKSVKATQSLFNKFLELLGLKDKLSINVRNDLVNTTLSVTNSSALGFKPAMGLRDLEDYFVRYGALYGFDRAANGLKLAMRPGSAEMMHNLGMIPGDISTVEFSSAAEVARTRLLNHAQKLPGYIQKIAETGLKVSLQKDMYRITHAAAYLDTREVALREVSRFVKGEITKDKMARNVKLYTYDPGIIREFIRFVDSGQTDKAADFLARETSRKVVFIFGQANHPWGWRSNTGRLAMQFGTWSANAKTFFLRGLTQGTAADRLAFASRLSMGQAAVFLSGHALGFNMWGWYLLPGLFFGGGPLFQAGLMVTNLASGFESDRAMARNRLKMMFPAINRPGSLFIPGSYMLKDIMKAVRDGDNVVEFGGQLIGIPLLRGSSWLEDSID